MMKFACVNSVTLQYKLDGQDAASPLVFINSPGTDLRIWDSVIPTFAHDFTILRYDQRGHGLSDAPPGPYSIRTLSNDLDTLMKLLGLNHPVLVGISVGGMIALDYTLQHPDSPRALVLCDTAAQIGTVDGWDTRIEGIRSRGMQAMARELAPRWFAPDFRQRRPDDYQGCLNMLARMPDEGYIATCEALRDADLQDVVGSIQVPALVLCGAGDIATPPDSARALAASLPNARFELIQDAGHLTCVEQPDVVATAISHFLAENGYV